MAISTERMIVAAVLTAASVYRDLKLPAQEDLWREDLSSEDVIFDTFNSFLKKMEADGK